MNATKQLACALALGTASFVATAQTAAEHAQHHPEGATPTAAPATPVTPEQQMSAMDRQLQLMRDMSRRLAEAKTPQERQALMAEHQKTLQDSMKMMGQMQGMPMAGMGMMGGGMMMGGAGMPGGPSMPPPAVANGAAAPVPGMGPQMMGQMMQRHAMMEKRLEMMQSMMQMMMDRMPAPPTK